MTDRELEQQRRMYDALKRITQYQPPEKLRKQAEKQYGLEGDEAIEYAYENVLSEARQAIKGVRRPKTAAALAPQGVPEHE